MLRAPQHSNIYIQGLDLSIDEQMLTGLFHSYGVVQSVRLIRPAQAQRRSLEPRLSAAFVKLETVSQAEAAISALNGANLLGNSLLVRLADHDVFNASESGMMPPPSDNIYCKNLPLGLTEVDLHCLFSPFGEVASSRILCHGDVTGEGGSAMVRMATKQQAERAVQGLRGHCVRGSLHPLVVRFADSVDVKAKKQARQGGTSLASPASRSEVGSQAGLMPALPSALPTTFSQLAQLSLQPSNLYNPYSQLFDPSGSTSFMPPLPSVPLHQQLPSAPLQPAVVPQSTQSVTSLYVSNLPPDASKLFLYETFSPFGAIFSIKVLVDDQGNNRGVAFVNFSEAVSAATAISALQNLTVGDRKIHVAFQTRKVPLPADPKYLAPYLHF